MIQGSPSQLARTALKLAEKHGPVDAAEVLRTFLARRGQSNQLPFILAALASLKQAEAPLILETATPLSSTLENEFREKVRTIDSKELSFRVDPKLVGGFRLYRGSLVYDSSVRNSLKQLKKSLTEVTHAE